MKRIYIQRRTTSSEPKADATLHRTGHGFEKSGLRLFKLMLRVFVVANVALLGVCAYSLGPEFRGAEQTIVSQGR